MLTRGSVAGTNINMEYSSLQVSQDGASATNVAAGVGTKRTHSQHFSLSQGNSQS